MSAEYIKEQLNIAGIEADTDKCALLDAYLSHISETNRQFNLTAVTEYDEMVEKHIVDSLLLFSDKNVSRETFFDDNGAFDGVISRITGARETEAESAENVSRETFSMIDVGTGAGLPGIPVKIYCPDLHVTLLDSLNKRVNFLKRMAEELQLTETDAIRGRAEDIARQADHREKYDLCVSRAVANMSTLLELCLPFVKTGGYFVAYKSENVSEEIKNAKRALKLFGGHITEVRHVTLPGSEAGRTFIIVKKTSHTPDLYPRRAGTPSKNPL